MKLVNFQVQNYRSVNDSGHIEVRDRTALVGRNESGKTNLLLALASLKPPGGMEALSFTKDFPRDRLRSEFSENVKVVDTTWELTAAEQTELGRVFPRAKTVSRVTMSRRFKALRYIGFVGLPPLRVDRNAVQGNLTKISQSVHGALRVADDATANAVKASLAQLSDKLGISTTLPATWAASVPAAIDGFTQALRAANFTLSELATANLDSIRRHASTIESDDKAHAEAREWVSQQLPVFMYLSEYPELNGHQNIPEYLGRKQNGNLTEADRNFEKLAKVADLDPAQLNSLLAQDHEERQLLTNRAGATVTRRLRDLWTDRPLKIRFALDAQHFDTLVSDPNAAYDVEVNLDERSRGFKWFFSFYVTFAADTAGGPAENAILLLDEPGLYLHATAQRDLLEHFGKNFKNQIIYTTHSPFMIPVNDLASIRTVNIDQDQATTVTNDPTGDHRTLFPLQAALGYDLTQTMFIGQHNLVVEGVSDYWYLSAVSDYLCDNGGQALPRELVITPAGGAQKVSYMATLLAAQRLSVLVLLDDEKDALATAEELVRSKLVRNDSVISVADAFSAPRAGGADIEDVLEPQVFADLVNQSYAKELAATPITLNPNIPRIVKRYEEAFRGAGMEFHKTRPAKLFLRRMAEDPACLTPLSQQRFETLFGVISQRLRDLTRRSREPFA